MSHTLLDEILLFLPTAEIDPSVKSPPLVSAVPSFHLKAILRFQVECNW